MKRVLAVVCAALFVDSLLYSVAVPVLPAYSTALGASGFQVGLLFGAYAVGLLVASPVAGAVSDRVGRRAPLVAGSFGIAAATAIFVASDAYWLLLSARVVQGVAAAVVWTAGAALVADVFPAERLGTAMGAVLASTSLGLILGPPVGGVLAEWFGRQAPFLVTAVVAAGNGFAQLLAVPPAAARRPRPARLGRILAHRPAFAAAAAVAFAASALTFLEPTLPLDMAARLGAGAAAVGVAFGVATLVHAAAAVWVGHVAARCRYRLFAGAGLVAMGLVVPVLAVARSLAAVVLVLAAFALALTFVLVPALPELARLVEHLGAGYGGAYALFNAAYAVGMLVGPLAGGAGLAAAPVPVVYAVAGGAVAAGGVFLLLLTRSHHAQRQVGPARGAPVPARPAG
jgi:multidrug resistance protein